MTEKQKLPCGCTPEGSPVYWNEFNGVVQCHKCGAAYSFSPLPHQDGASEIKHQLEYNIHSCKVSWCPICKEHFYTEDHYHIVSNQYGASAEDVLLSVLQEQFPYDQKYCTNPKSLFDREMTLRAMHQFAKSEVEKAVADKDREIAKWKQSYHTSERHRLEDAASAIDDQNMQFERHKNHITLLQSELSTSNVHRTRLIEAIRKWIKAWRKDQQEIRRIKSELSKANERVKELEKYEPYINRDTKTNDEPRDKSGQTFDQWAEDNGCY